MEEAIRTLRPFKRTNSMPGSLDDPMVTYTFPSFLDEAVNGPRRAFSTFDKGMQITPLDGDASCEPRADRVNSPPGSVSRNASATDTTRILHSDDGVPTVVAAAADGSMTDENSSSDGDSGAARVEVEQPVAVDKLGTPRAEAAAGDDGAEEAPAADAADGGACAQEAPVPAEADAPPAAPETLVQLTATEECLPYDATAMRQWLVDLRHCTSHCPRGIARFAEEFKERQQSGADAAANRATWPAKAAGAVPSFGSKLGTTPVFSPDSAGLSAHSGLHGSGRQALEALGDIWEDRKDIPIAVTSSVRRHGLFGEAEKKELRQMLIAVLNKVTSDPSKFREVRNELLRLPIPEASPEQLDDVVSVFFTKAVREQHFSHSYADLIAALCTVPEGQHITGDRKLSLEHRLRLSLLRRCQREFGVAAAEDGSGDEETAKERRELMVGNVRFVIELFLRGIVVDRVVASIFAVCCTGSELGTIGMPPRHIPTEAQVDEIITAVNAVGMRFFSLKRGQQMLPALVENVQHWTKNHPINRCRFKLMSTADTLQGFLTQIQDARRGNGGSPTAEQLGIASPPVFSPLSDSGERFASPAAAPTAPAAPAADAFPPVPPLSVSAASLSSPTNAAVTAGTPKTTVGGRPLPAPRSHRLTSNSSFLSGTDSVASPALSNTVGSPSLEQSGSPVYQEAPPPPSRTRQHPSLSLTSGTFGSPGSLSTSPAAARSPVTTAAVAKLMGDFAANAATASETAARVVEQFEDPLPVLAVWLGRCLSVVKEEKTRLRTGELLAALLEVTDVQAEDLREAVFHALQRAVQQNLHEDLHVFRFWSQCVLSDPQRLVMDEEMLEDGLEFLFECRPDALRAYLTDVGTWLGSVVAGTAGGPAYVASSAANGYVRYRPLVRLHLALLASGCVDTNAAALKCLDFPDVRRSNVEVDVFCALYPEKPNFESLFEKVRTSPRLRADPTLAAGLMSAVLMTEMTRSDRRCYVDEAVPILLVAVDGANRAEREVALVSEVHELLGSAAAPSGIAVDVRLLLKLRNYRVVSDEAIDLTYQYYASLRAPDAAEELQPAPAPRIEAGATPPAVAPHAQPAERGAAHKHSQESSTGCPSERNSSVGGGSRLGGTVGTGGDAGGWRSSNESLRSDPRSPDSSAHPGGRGHSPGQGSSAGNYYRRGAGASRGRGGAGAADTSSTYRVTGYRRAGGAAPRGGRAGRYGYQNSDSYYRGGKPGAGSSGGGGGRTSTESRAEGENRRAKK